MHVTLRKWLRTAGNNRQLMMFAWRTETMILPDHKVEITEQSLDCYAHSKDI